MDDLISEFTAETREMLAALGGEIVAWEAAPNDRARLDEIFRFVHTVKGNCGFFDLPRLETLSHAAEDVLAEVRAGKRSPDSALVSAVLAIIDRIGELVQAIETGEAVASVDDEQLIEALAKPSAQTEESSPGAGGNAEVRKTLRSIRLSVDLLDRMMSGVSDMVLARNELGRRLRESPGDVGIEQAFERLSVCIAEMRDAITRTRMQRMDSLFVMIPRMVRDLCSELDKDVSLEIDGGDVELDREMVEMIRDPLIHMIRNAIDHGIESPAERASAGKPANGNLAVNARQSGNQILIEIADDGKGIDGAGLVKKAIANGALSREQSERLSPAQKTALIFEPGISTAQEVTSLSGRGVGMDVVRANIERIGGLVEVESKLGYGTRVTLRVPLTLTIIPALTTSVAGQSYAIPRSAIEEIVRTSSGMVRIEGIGGCRMVSIRDRRLPLVSLADVLGVQHERPADEQTMIVLRPAGGEDYALCVDAVHDHEELVVKPAAPAIMAAGVYAGTTLADDGCPILLLDASGIADCAGITLDQADDEKAAVGPIPEVAQVAEIPALLFRTLAGGRRVVPLSVVERIEEIPADRVEHNAGKLRIAIGEKILPLLGCDHDQVPGELRILRLSDGTVELAYGLAEVVDIVAIVDDVLPASTPGEVAGVTLIAGEQVEVIDSHWLFGNEAKARPDHPLVCALPADDPWMHNILRPLIHAAGHRTVVVGDAGHEEADILIAAAEAAAPQLKAGTVLRIRSKPTPSHDADDSIYRYDRAGLLAALHMATGEKRQA